MSKLTSFERRQQRTRSKIRRIEFNKRGADYRPRLSVFRSLNHIYAQIIDDRVHTTLVAASTVDKDLRDKTAAISKADAAVLVGELIARRATEKGITEVVFDKGGYPKFHGRIKKLADSAREKGLKF